MSDRLECPHCESAKATKLISVSEHAVGDGVHCRRCGRKWIPESGEVLEEPHDPGFDVDTDAPHADVFATGFSSSEYFETSAASVAARAFAQQLERVIATLDTSKYRAVEVLTPRVQIGGARLAGGQPEIRLVEEGELLADELIEQGYLHPSTRVERYSADDVAELQTYAHAALDRDELAPLERFVDRKLDVDDEQVTPVAKRIARSIRQHGDAADFADDVDVGGDA